MILKVDVDLSISFSVVSVDASGRPQDISLRVQWLVEYCRRASKWIVLNIEYSKIKGERAWRISGGHPGKKDRGKPPTNHWEERKLSGLLLLIRGFTIALIVFYCLLKNLFWFPVNTELTRNIQGVFFSHWYPPKNSICQPGGYQWEKNTLYLLYRQIQ